MFHGTLSNPYFSTYLIRGTKPSVLKTFSPFICCLDKYTMTVDGIIPTEGPQNLNPLLWDFYIYSYIGSNYNFIKCTQVLKVHVGRKFLDL